MDTSHARDVDSVIRLVRSDEPDVAYSVRGVNRHDQAVLVALEIEYYAVLGNDTGIRNPRVLHGQHRMHSVSP
jgi:hypothetical protein